MAAPTDGKPVLGDALELLHVEGRCTLPGPTAGTNCGKKFVGSPFQMQGLNA